MRILKDLRFILVVLLIVSWAAAGFFIYKLKTSNDESIVSKEAEIATLEDYIASIGELVPAYVVASDVPSGKQIEESDLAVIDVPMAMATNVISDSSEILGWNFKLPMTAGTIITYDCVYEEEITDDMRYYDVLLDLLPIGLHPGSFIDLRMKVGTGSDYVVIPHRQVIEINGNVLKLILTEEDIQIFSGALVDNIVFNSEIKVNKDINQDEVIDDNDFISPIGSYLYAVEYVIGGVQEKASNFYAPSSIVQSIINNDPNITSRTLTPEDLILARNMITMGIIEDYDDVKNIAVNFKDVLNKIEQGRSLYDARMKEEAIAAEREAQGY